MEGRWMGGVGQSLDDGPLLTGREVQLSRRTISEIGGDDPVDLCSEGLYGN
jgi:hypothetical protein